MIMGLKKQLERPCHECAGEKGTIPEGSFAVITSSYNHEDRCYLNWHEPDGSTCSSIMLGGTVDEYKLIFRLSDECYVISFEEFGNLDSWWKMDEVQSLVK